MDEAQIVVGYTFQLLPKQSIEMDGEQPRKDLKKSEINRLKRSIEKHGIQQPIAVNEYAPGRYKIIDGHRRYLASKALNLETLPCLVYKNLEAGDLEVRRYEMQNIRRAWKPLERSNALHKMRRDLGVQSARELTEYIPMSASAIRDSLSLLEEHSHYFELWRDHKLNESFQVEMNRLKKYLCKIGDMEVDEIIENMLERIKPDNNSVGKIRNAKELRIIRTAFKDISLYEPLIAEYLNNFDMKTAELEERMVRAGRTADIEKITKWYSAKLSTRSPLTDEEENALEHLIELRLSVKQSSEVYDAALV